jgi:hypothetical protein
MLNYFDTEAVIALIAPRPVLLDGDQTAHHPDGIREIEAAVRPVHGLYENKNDFENVVYAASHAYTPRCGRKP